MALRRREPGFLAEIEEIVDIIRSTGQPGFLVIETRRLGPHSKGDDLRDTAEMEAIQRRDPLSRLGDTLSVNERAAIEEANLQFLAEVRNVAEASPESRFRSRPQHLFGSGSSLTPSDAAETKQGINVRAALNGALREMLLKNADVIVLGEDLHDPYGGAFKVTTGLSTEFPGRVISTPISEAANCRLGDRTCFSGFSAGCRDHVRRLRDARNGSDLQSRGEVPRHVRQTSVPLVIRTPSGGRRGYGLPSQAGKSDGRRTGPDGSVPQSADMIPASLLTRATIDWPYPTVFFEHKLLYGAMQDPAGYTALPADAADPGAALFPTLSRGGADADLTIVAYGGMLPIVEKIALQSKDEEIKVQIIVPSLLSPRLR